MNTLSINEFVETVRNTNTIFGVSFIKKSTGELRNMQARMHVSKGVIGALPAGHREAEDAANNVLTVYDMQVFDATKSERGAFRRINLDQLVGCTLRGTKYHWDNAARMLVA